MEFKFNDGGREAAGFKGTTGDCTCRAIAIATEQPYQDVYDMLNNLSKFARVVRGRRKSSARTGVTRYVYDKYLKALGWVWIPTMKIGSGCKVHLRAEELPKGRLIVRVSKHMTAVIDGVIHDVYNPDRYGKRCVYGYFIKPITKE